MTFQKSDTSTTFMLSIMTLISCNTTHVRDTPQTSREPITRLVNSPARQPLVNLP